MATFCGKCGSPLADQAVFCGGCGLPVPPKSQAPAWSASPVPSAGGLAPATGSTAPASVLAGTTPATKSSNSLLKVGLVLVGIILVGGLAALGAVYYAVHKVSDKIHSASQQALGDSKPSGGGLSTLLSGNSDAQSQSSSDSARPGGDLCRFLSKEDVSASTGTKVIRADPSPDGCVYIANGDPADALTKHMGGMLQKKGADPKSQEMLQKFAGGLFKQQEQSDKDLSAEAKKGEIPVVTVSFSSGGHGVSEMKLNRKFMTQLGSTDLPGIGDEAFNSADGMMTVRKGNNMFRIMYISCPCTIDAITPLAQKIANAL
jgi:hypothetical protein